MAKKGNNRKPVKRVYTPRKPTKGKSRVSRPAAVAKKKPVSTSKKVTAKKKAPGKVSKKGTGKKVAGVRKKVLGLSGTNFSNFNQVQSAVKAYLQQTGRRYTLKDLNGYTSTLLSNIRKKARGEVQMQRALQNIDLFVSQFFASSLTQVNKIDLFHWWRLRGVIAELPQNAYVYMDNSELIGESHEMSQWEGQAYQFERIGSMLNKAINDTLERKGYAWFIQLIYRSDELNKEFVYFLLLREGDERIDFSNEEIRDWVLNNKISELDVVFNRVPYETAKKDSLYQETADATRIKERFAAEPGETLPLPPGFEPSHGEVKKLKRELKQKQAEEEGKKKRRGRKKKVVGPELPVKGRKELKTKKTGQETAESNLVALEREKQKTAAMEKERFTAQTEAAREKLRLAKEFKEMGFSNKEIIEMLKGL